MSLSKNILYLADVQGPEVVKARGIVRNYSIAGNAKVFGICKALTGSGHSVTIYSPGSVAERSGRCFPSQHEVLTTAKGALRIVYGSTIDNRYLRPFTELGAALSILPALFRKRSIDAVFVYNVTVLHLAVAVICCLFGKKVFLEYEDSAVASRTSSPPLWKRLYRVHERVFSMVASGALAPSLGLLDDLGIGNSLCIPGALNEDLVSAAQAVARPAWSKTASLRIIYAGGLDESKGIDRFLLAVEMIDTPLEIHVCGSGPLEQTIANLCLASRHAATFHGLVPREELVALMIRADVGINPHRSDLHGGGSWPFKVVEYLAACGTVFCNLSADIPSELRNNLYLYQANDPDGIKVAFADFLTQWAQVTRDAAQRRQWAIGEFGPDGLARKVEQLMAGLCAGASTA